MTAHSSIPAIYPFAFVVIGRTTLANRERDDIAMCAHPHAIAAAVTDADGHDATGTIDVRVLFAMGSLAAAASGTLYKLALYSALTTQLAGALTRNRFEHSYDFLENHFGAEKSLLPTVVRLGEWEIKWNDPNELLVR